MTTLDDDLTELLKLNSAPEHREWCGRLINGHMEVGTITPDQGRAIWHSAFGASEPPPPANPTVEADFRGTPSGATAVYALGVLMLAGLGAIGLILWLAGAAPH